MSFLKNVGQYFYSTSSPPVQYHGLLNQGATCYLNSVLQVLFMTEDFREAVERHTCENPETKCIDRHLTALFNDLKGHTAYTYNITKNLGIDRVYEQQDAAEYFEKILSLTSREASQIFSGQLTHKTICSTCGTETGTDGAFWHLPLSLVNSCNENFSVVNGVSEHFRASNFSGENQMYCDKCDGKSDATTKCVIKHHPEVLMLLLKRFEFDYRYMTYVKINCTVDVPYTLQIPENQTYELYAVVEHIGDLRSGHYTATIKSQDDERWYRFNDDRVTLLDYRSFQGDNCQKSDTAYLLFYRKANVHAADSCTQDIREASTPGGFQPATSNISDQCQDAVKMSRRGEVEGAAEAGNDAAVAVSIDRNEETGIQEISVGSRGVGPPELCCNVEGQAEKREHVSGETQLEESVKDQDNDSGRLDDVSQRRPDINHDFKPEVSGRHAIHGHLNKQDEMSDEQTRVMDVKTDKDGKTGDDEQSEKKGKSFDRDVVGLVDVRQNINEDLGGAQEDGQNYGLKPVSVDKQGDERMKMIVNVDEEVKTGADERGNASGRGKLYKEIQDNGRVGDNEQNMQKDDQEGKRRSSSKYKKREQQREERDVQGVKEQKKGDDDCQNAEDQNNGGLDDIKQNQSEQKTSVTHTRHEDAAVVKQAKEQENKRGEHIQNTADSESAGSRRLTENRRGGSVEKTRRGDSEPKARTKFNENTMEGGRGLEKSRQCYVKIIEEEIKDGVPTSSETKCISIQTVGGTSQDGIKRVENNEGNVKRQSDPKTDEKDSLSGRFDHLNLSVPQKRRGKRGIGNAQEGNETNSASHSNANKRQKVSQEQAAEMEHAVTTRGEKQHRKKIRKQKKTTMCFPNIFCKRQKNAEQTSESD